jgi:hypothetical protein
MPRTTPSRASIDPLAATAWNEADKARRKQIRRLIRVGWTQETVADAKLAIAYAQYQRTRPWYRFAPLWAALITVGALVLGMTGLYGGSVPSALLAGAMLGFAGNLLLVKRNYRRIELVNAELLASAPGPSKGKGAKAKGPKGTAALA